MRYENFEKCKAPVTKENRVILKPSFITIS